MKYLFVIALIAVVGYLFPQLYEETNGPCQALEKKAIRANLDRSAANSILGGLALSLTDGGLGREMAEEEYPQLPAQFGCIATYYDFPKD